MSKQPHPYTVLRYVHDTGTGEFANVGVVLTSPDAGYADVILRPTYGRLSKMFPGMNGDHFRRVIRHLQSRFDEISARVREEMNVGDRPSNALDLAHRVIAADDSSFQWSTMGSGLAEDLPATLESIYHRMVELYDEKANVLHKTPVGHEIIRENEAEHFAAEMAEKIAAHDAEFSAESGA